MSNREIWYLIRLTEWETGFDLWGRATRIIEKPEPLVMAIDESMTNREIASAQSVLRRADDLMKEWGYRDE